MEHVDKSLVADLYDVLRLLAQGDARAAGKLLKNEFYLKHLASEEEKRAINAENAEIAKALEPQDSAPAASEEVQEESSVSDEGSDAADVDNGQGTTVPSPEQTGDESAEEQPAPGSVNTKAN